MKTVYHRNENEWGRTSVIVMAMGKALAMVTVTNGESDVAVIHDIMVHPSKREQGFGDALLAEAHDEARRLGARTLRLSVEPGTWMQDWYYRNGFRTVGILVYEGHPVDVMEK